MQVFQHGQVLSHQLGHVRHVFLVLDTLVNLHELEIVRQTLFQRGLSVLDPRREHGLVMDELALCNGPEQLFVQKRDGL